MGVLWKGLFITYGRAGKLQLSLIQFVSKTEIVAASRKEYAVFVQDTVSQQRSAVNDVFFPLQLQHKGDMRAALNSVKEVHECIAVFLH